MFPGVQCGIGPPTDEGFFYDFVVPRPFVPEDLDAIEKKMRELADQDLIFERQMWPRDEAKQFFSARGEPLKVQLIDEKTEGQTHVSCYTIKDKETFVDFCVGPHVPSTGKLKAFKLLTTSNAYWKGDARNQPMQRVYGTAFFSDKELQDYLRRIEEAKKRDHRKLGRDQRLFMFHQWAPGATFWLPKGTVLYNTLGNYMRGVLIPAGYTEVKAPIVFNKELWVTSGHWQHYRENMFLVESEGEQMGLKAMNCPGHYPDVRQRGPQLSRPADPLPRADAAAPQRGVGRAHRADARAAVQPGRWALLRDGVADRRGGRAPARPRAAGPRDFGLEYPDQALDAARGVHGHHRDVEPRGGRAEGRARPGRQAYTINEGDGAFYGPKIDFDITDAIGRKWQCSTIQLDYMNPERFDLKYVGADNAEHRPVVIHRAIFGSLERFIALLIEHFAGAWPLWLAPVQAVVLPISDRHRDYAVGVRDGSPPPGCASNWTTARRRLVIRSERPSCRRSPTCW